MKRAALVLVLAMVGGALFASGVQEGSAPGGVGPGAVGSGGARSGFAGPGVAVPAAETEMVGTYEEVDGYPVIRADGKTYTAGVPGFRWLNLDLEPGDEVTVRGYLFEETESLDGHVRVTQATIDGTEYEVAPPRTAQTSGRGPHHGYGMMGSRSRGGGPGMRGRQGYGPQGYAPSSAPQGYGPGYGPQQGYDRQAPAPGYSGRGW